ncbi:MAG: chorismate synthase [Deltaproteobacteria bacterium]|nr:chorismate synthase [Deltaproteobacteria bacterium]
MLRYLTSGESHGKCLVATIEGMPSGLSLSASDVNADLARRQGGYGRGGRQKIEKDTVEYISGVRHGSTLGSPLAMLIENRDWANWSEKMASGPVKGAVEAVTKPRPGHADLAGAMKYFFTDVRNVLERSSARETAARVAVGAVAKKLLKEFGIEVYSYVTSIGGVECSWKKLSSRPDALHEAAEGSEVRCPDAAASKKMIGRIDEVRKAGDSLGGTFEVVITGAPPGLGSHVHWDRKLDAMLAMALMSIQAIKGVQVGMGFKAALTPGSRVHDEIMYRKAQKKRGWWPAGKAFFRPTNNAGGIEGGMSNGEDIRVSAAMKPIPTLYKPLRSVDMITKKPYEASIERSDICAVPAASVVAEAVSAFTIAAAFVEKFGGDSVKELSRNYEGYLKQLSGF